MLLHSCPDTVHRFLLRKTQTSTPLFRGSPTVKTPSVGQHPCYSGLQVQGTANSPAVRKLYDLILYDGMTCRPSACLVYMAAAVLSSRSLTNKHCIKIHKNTFYCFFIIHKYLYPNILFDCHGQFYHKRTVYAIIAIIFSYFYKSVSKNFCLFSFCCTTFSSFSFVFGGIHALLELK